VVNTIVRRTYGNGTDCRRIISELDVHIAPAVARLPLEFCEGRVAYLGVWEDGWVSWRLHRYSDKLEQDYYVEGDDAPVYPSSDGYPETKVDYR